MWREPSSGKAPSGPRERLAPEARALHRVIPWRSGRDPRGRVGWRGRGTPPGQGWVRLGGFVVEPSEESREGGRAAEAAARAETADGRVILEALARIERRLDRVEALAARAKTGAEGALATVTDAVDGWMGELEGRGVYVDERVKTILRLVERATEPDVLEAVQGLLEMAANAPGAVATIVDSVDGAFARMHASGIDVEARMRNVLETFDAMAERAEPIGVLLRSGVLDPAAVEVVADAGRALAQAAAERGRPVGVLGLFRALGEDDIRTAAGFVVRVARHLGQLLEAKDRAALPPAAEPAREEEPR